VNVGWARHVVFVAGVCVALGAGSGCSVSDTAAPHCSDTERVAIVAQSVPTAAYLPCITALAAGWHVGSFDAHDGGTRFSLVSDRASRPVHVRLQHECELGDATPVTPRDEAVRTFAMVKTIAPDYSARLFDVFPGGCITYDFRFRRGPHVALVDEFERMVGLLSRRVLRQELRDNTGIELRD
jgi:hypothetical protein